MGKEKSPYGLVKEQDIPQIKETATMMSVTSTSTWDHEHNRGV